MHETILNKYAINQVAYIVEDLEEAALEHSKLFGSGPFLYMDPVTMAKAVYKGEEIELTMQQAYGQFGNLQIEFIKVWSTPNPYGCTGFHHFSNWVDDYDAAIAEFAAAGFEPVIEMESGGGLRIAYIDTAEKYGHCVEIHPPIQGFWDMIKKAADDWDGTNPYRKFGA